MCNAKVNICVTHRVYVASYHCRALDCCALRLLLCVPLIGSPRILGGRRSACIIFVSPGRLICHHVFICLPVPACEVLRLLFCVVFCYFLVSSR